MEEGQGRRNGYDLTIKDVIILEQKRHIKLLMLLFIGTNIIQTGLLILTYQLIKQGIITL